jgi:hypothetical protein
MTTILVVGLLLALSVPVAFEPISQETLKGRSNCSSSNDGHGGARNHAMSTTNRREAR